MNTIQPNTIIEKGKCFVSIGIDTKEVAIVSKSTGEFYPLTHKGIALNRAKRKFKSRLCSREYFCFTHMSENDIKDLLTILN